MGIQFPDGWADLRVVLVHDWLTGMRGGERCLELLCRGMPEAPICTLVHDPVHISDTINGHRILTSGLQRTLLTRRYFRALLPLLPGFIESMRSPEADLVISTSHCVAKGILPPPGAKHLCYCFTPMRYGLFAGDYFGRNPLIRIAAHPMLSSLRRWDVRTSSRVDRFVAISRHVQRRIRMIYQRDADVVYPPVDTDRCTPGDGGPADYDLIVSALVPYKRIDLAVQAYNRLGYPLHIVGTGSGFQRLKRIARPHITFAGWLSDEEILAQYRGCRLLVFPGEEDFGIVPVEAQACGKPVVAFGRGGLLETVIPGQTGVFFDRPTPEDLALAVEEAAGIPWNPTTIRRHAEQFGIQPFLDGLDTEIRKTLT